ncbi:hypothetical protein [Streptomyces sp. NPDC048473]|uniref:hypothetical protein n=1 Tax=unclassified Streptomyces TaxID=2593676 RepID=UPI00371EF35D
MIWSVEDLARDTVRRQGTGMSMERVAQKVTEAATRERETQQALRSPGWSPTYEAELDDVDSAWARERGARPRCDLMPPIWGGGGRNWTRCMPSCG